MMGARPAGQLDPLLAEGLDWLRRIETGPFDREDLAAFLRWREASPLHDAAYREAEDLGLLAETAGRQFLAERNGAPVEIVPFPVHTASSHSRRVFLGGAMAASFAGAIAVGRGLDWLPGIGPSPDFSTAKGERRTIALASGLGLTLDAETRVNVVRAGSVHHVTLLDGRVEVASRMDNGGGILLSAGKARAAAREARYDASLAGGSGCVTCLSGVVAVRYGEQRIALGAAQQLRYDSLRLDAAKAVDPAMVSAWSRGQLIFHETPLSEVVSQVNRYRHGRIVIARSSVGALPVSGVFHTDHMDGAVDQIQALTGTHALALPGGYVMLS